MPPTNSDQALLTVQAGRSCPLAYRYHPSDIAQAATEEAETLYVIGGLYGNPFALASVLAMAAAEKHPVTLCFNGDFNWFNIDHPTFQQINHTVLQHHAIQGNVEYELHQENSDAGCGCAYPEHVAHEVVERSNQIHAQLQQTARHFPQLQQQLSQLPLYRRYQLGSHKIGVVHGDAQSLAGWQFDAAHLRQIKNDPALADFFALADVDVFASSHTCLPILKQIKAGKKAENNRVNTIINNGAAGIPNFQHTQYGVLSRISLHPCATQSLYSAHIAHPGKHLQIDALAIEFDDAAWQSHFLHNWPAESAAYASYFQRICAGPEWTIHQANALI